ncbi:MAG: type II toxin-antitoxin system RelB/DinJ family antitoxin [Defluviitaleaceae bacterium]|nr:type II toxin-antitoxin system RelB/DinJ family antitoxin [Defluviitaleaceae bacterium]
MTKNETLHIRVNETVKLNAENTLSKLGISISDAVTMLLYQIPIVGGMPFDLRMPAAPERVIVRSNEDLYAILEESMNQVNEGRVMDADAAMLKIRDKYGFSG